MLLERSPLLPLLPQARVLSTPGVDRMLGWTVATLAGLGAYDSVTGASAVTQLLPAAGSSTVNVVAGDPLLFLFQLTGETYLPAGFEVQGTLPAGLTQTGTENSTTDSITGAAQEAGAFPLTLVAWENPGHTGFSARSLFILNVTLPPPPSIVTPPAGGGYAPGDFVILETGHTGGRAFTWSLNGEPLPAGEAPLFSRDGARRFLTAPATDPGPGWRSGGGFDDSTWTPAAGGIGYDNDPFGLADYRPFYAPPGVDMTSRMYGSGKPVAVHLRMPFTLPEDRPLSFLKLRVQCDDGFVAWINGTEVAAQNRNSSTFQWNSAASADVADTSAILFREIDLSRYLNLLRPGENLLAVQAMNRTATSPDFLFNCELAAGINATNSARLILPALQLADTGDYTVRVANPAGAVESGAAAVLLRPSIVSQPESATVAPGGSVELHVTAGGSPPFAYQWYEGKAGEISRPVEGATDESFTPPPLTATTRYWVRVSSPAGSADSTTAVLTVDDAADPFTVWQNASFPPEMLGDPALSGVSADPDGDGLPNGVEYLLGTSPLAASASPLAVSAGENGGITLTFTATAAQGPGYAGLTRLHTLESAADLAGPWTAVPDFTDIPGAGQTVTHSPAREGGRRFYRLRVRLAP